MKEPIALVALESASLSKEGIFDFLFGKKKEDETPSMKRLEKLEAEAKLLKAGPGLDVLQGRTKPSQELLDKLMSIAEKHLAPSQVYKQNSQLFDVLCKLVALPAPSPYGVSEDLGEAQTANEAKKVLLDYIKLMEPQVKLCRATTKRLVTGPAKPEALFEDVTKHYADNWAFIKRYCYANARDHRTYEAATLAQDFGYPCGTMGNRDTPGVEALYEENPKQFKVWADTLEDIADAAGEFEMLWSNGKSGKDWDNFNPAYDDVEFLIHARCALLSYALDLKVSQEGKELVEAIDIATEAYHDLEVLVTAMESAKIDPNFGKYNLPLYRSSMEAIFDRLGLSVKQVSTESFDDSQILSVEGLGKVLQGIGKTIKDLIAKFIAWMKSVFGQKSEKAIEKTKEVGETLSNVEKATWDKNASFSTHAFAVCSAAGKNDFNSLTEFVEIAEDEVKRLGSILANILRTVSSVNREWDTNADGYENNRWLLDNLEDQLGTGGKLDKEENREPIADVGLVATIRVGCELEQIRSLHKNITNLIYKELNAATEVVPAMEKLEKHMKLPDNQDEKGLYRHVAHTVRSTIESVRFILKTMTDLTYSANNTVLQAIRECERAAEKK